MANADLIKKWKKIRDPRAALAEIVEHEDFLGYDPYYAELRHALLNMAERALTPAGLRVRADMVRGALNDSGSTARHLELAADKIERLMGALRAIADEDYDSGYTAQTYAAEAMRDGN